MSDSLQPMDYTVYGILQARTLEWAAFSFSKGSPQPRDHPSEMCPGWRNKSHALFTRRAKDRFMIFLSNELFLLKMLCFKLSGDLQ